MNKVLIINVLRLNKNNIKQLIVSELSVICLTF